MRTPIGWTAHAVGRTLISVWLVSGLSAQAGAADRWPHDGATDGGWSAPPGSTRDDSWGGGWRSLDVAPEQSHWDDHARPPIREGAGGPGSETRYRFRGDPPLGSDASQVGAGQDLYRFRPLTEQERGRQDQGSHWRPLASPPGERPPTVPRHPRLMDALTPPPSVYEGFEPPRP
ncbi:MAG: hypothetical protein EOM21_08100 [Gammaproteobacteria bacterium]|nr:hypothetical protein [Gammaproteobacteria bacterium]